MTGSEHNSDPLRDVRKRSSPPTQATNVSATRSDRWSRIRRWAGDFSGAFADLGTFLPLIIGVFAVQRLDPSGVLVGFGVFALAVALIYRRPMPVQPMKAVAAIVIAGGLGASAIAASGLLLGLALSALAITGVVGRLARIIPQSVLTGIQLGVGFYLAWAGIRLVAEEPAVGGLALAALLILQRTAFKPLAALAVVVGAGIWGVSHADAVLPNLAWGLWHPQLQFPDWNSMWIASQTLFLPQLALTMTNAALITATIAGEFFPQDRTRITPDRLALTSGVLNVLLAPLGAFPMCHGAGGLVVQHKFGARTGLAPALFGVTCLSFGILLGPSALALLSLLPLAAVGALLMFAGTNLVFSRGRQYARPDGLIVILLTGLTCVVVNVAVGLVAGLVLEFGRSLVIRRRSPT